MEDGLVQMPALEFQLAQEALHLGLALLQLE